MIGFNWLKNLSISTADSKAESETSPASVSLSQRVLTSCQEPITLGDLSDRLGIDYRALAPVLVALMSDRQIHTVFLPKHGLNCIHYVYEPQTPPNRN